MLHFECRERSSFWEVANEGNNEAPRLLVFAQYSTWNVSPGPPRRAAFLQLMTLECTKGDDPMTLTLIVHSYEPQHAFQTIWATHKGRI